MWGRSLHVGLNSVDPDQYGGWDGELVACENDARAMVDIAARHGFQRRTLVLTKAATLDRIVAEFGAAADAAHDGDVFWFSYSGHGTRIPDANGDERDGYDEALVLYDGLLIDDRLWALFQGFRPGVRVIMTTDACHSATIARAFSWEVGIPRGRIRTASWRAVSAYWHAHAADHADMPRAAEGDVACELLTLSACKDTQTALDGNNFGAFTESLIRAERQAVDWGHLCRRIKRSCPSSQTPVLAPYTASDHFLSAKPFALDRVKP